MLYLTNNFYAHTHSSLNEKLSTHILSSTVRFQQFIFVFLVLVAGYFVAPNQLSCNTFVNHVNLFKKPKNKNKQYRPYVMYVPTRMLQLGSIQKVQGYARGKLPLLKYKYIYYSLHVSNMQDANFIISLSAFRAFISRSF